jgi:hypothetical protein
MSEEQQAATDAEKLAEAAGLVSHSTDALVGHITALRDDFRAAREQAEADIEAAKAQAAADVAAERRDRRRASWKFAVIVAVDVVLSAVVLALTADQRATEAKLHDTQVAVLCPLYKVLAQATALPRVGETDQQQAVRLAAQEPIRNGYLKLGCEPLLPPATSLR